MLPWPETAHWPAVGWARLASVPPTEGGSRVGPCFLYLYSQGAVMMFRMEKMFNLC